MSRVPVTFGGREAGVARRPVRRLAGLVAAQALALALVAAYFLTGGAMAPDGGLQQLGLLSLNERVAGLEGTGRAALVVAPGVGADCVAKVAEASRRRDRALGVPSAYDVVVLRRDASGEAPAGLRVVADPDGRITRALALSRALAGCQPGYAVLDAGGVVRYRTYDDNWQRHGGEQMTLLLAVS